MAVNAQFYAGGSVEFDSQTDGNSHGRTEFSLSPEAGYSLNNKMDVGLELSLGMGSSTMNLNPLVEKESYFGWSLAPYFRYAVLQAGKFKVLGKASVFASGGSSTAVLLGGNGNTTANPVTLGFHIAPLLTYNLSKQFVLAAGLNFLDVGFSVTDGATRLYIGADSYDLASTGNFSIGFAYKF